MANSTAIFEQKIKDLEASLKKATSENSELKKSMKTQEEEWKTRLATAESKLGESEGKLQALNDRLVSWPKTYGVYLDNLSVNLLFHTFQPLYVYNLFCS